VGARLLAEGEDFPVQAISVGERAYGLQFHPEVTQAMIHRWTVRAAVRLSAPGAQPAYLQLQGRFMHDRAMEAWINAFLDHWLDRRALALPA
jgi:GMP synthase (glutamine-hydrolysing)